MGHIECIGPRNACKIWVRKSLVRDLLGDLDVDKSIILSHIFEKYNVKVWIQLHRLRKGANSF